MKSNKKALKRAFYRSRVTDLKKMIAFMLIVGIVTSIAYFCKYAYVEYAVSRAHIVLNYPEIAESKYPDGSRFTYYDFTCDENLEDALEIMQSRGKYVNFTVDDIRDNFYIYSYLDGSAVSSVSTARSEGNDFSYVANEYKITFVQPHDYKNPSIIRKFFSSDDSKEFLQVLVDVNQAKIARKLGGINGFKILTDASTEGNYDYTEEVNIYKTKINNIIACLKELEKKQPGFVSEKHGLSLNDLRGKYNFIISNNLDGINNFVESSGISKDLDQTTNKINVNIENYTVRHNKSASKVETNDFAMKNYDQTFTENLINVIQNSEYGLYQARPKTAFDTVARQKHESNEGVSEYKSKINIFSKELDIYADVAMTPEEHERLIVKCDGLIDALEKEYEELSTLANEVVEEYYSRVNGEFISTKITPKGLISKKLIVKMGIAFLLGVALAFVIAVFVTSFGDRLKINKKKKLIESIKARNITEEA
jgi:hypothetical protein